jgi:hypothetical protein
VIALACFGGVFLALWGATYAFYPPLMTGIRSAGGWLAGMLRGHSRFGRVFRRIESWGSYLPLIIALAVGTLIIVWTADAFIDIALALKEHNPTVQRVDSAVQQWIGFRRTPLTRAFFATISMVAGPLGMGVLVVTVLAVLMARRRFRLGAYLAVTAAGGALLNQWLKLHYLRQRPDLKETRSRPLQPECLHCVARHRVSADFYKCSLSILRWWVRTYFSTIREPLHPPNATRSAVVAPLAAKDDAATWRKRCIQTRSRPAAWAAAAKARRGSPTLPRIIPSRRRAMPASTSAACRETGTGRVFRLFVSPLPCALTTQSVRSASS